MLITLCAEFAGQTRDPDFTTEATEATEAGGKGVRIRLRTFLSFRSVSVISVASVVRSGADVRQTAVSTNRGQRIGAEVGCAQKWGAGFVQRLLSAILRMRFG